jgi:hypothetical protein
MTPEQARKFIADRLFQKMRGSLTADDFGIAWASLPEPRKQAIASQAVKGNIEQTGRNIQAMLADYAREKANVRADNIIADGTINLAEFSEIFD